MPYVKSKMDTVPAFSEEEAKRTKMFLAAKVASMMGRKLEEGDWGLSRNGVKNYSKGPCVTILE